MLRKQKIFIAVSFIVIICLLGTGLYAYYEFYLQETPIIEEEIPMEMDDRISPYLNQGLVLEVQRMRHRGLLDTIMRRGTSWKNKPMFYFISTIDSQEYISKNIASAGGVEGQQLFVTWDSMFQENKINRDVDEEQLTSEITLEIVEVVPVGLLGRRSQEEVRETISVVYDFKTGRWRGTDSFNDSDGYGHYLGDSFEVWFNIYQTDYDHDYIPYWTEVNVLHTDPNVSDLNLDPDGDGCPTTWEWKWGYDPNVHDNHSMMDPDEDGLDNVEEYMMETWFANPFHQEIYIEADGMQKGGLFDPAHVFWEESQQVMIERFAEHNICLFIDFGWPGTPSNAGGELLPHYETLSQDSGMMLQFYENHFPDERKGIFRYVVVGHNAGFCHPSKFNRYDTMAVDTSLYKAYFRRSAFTQRTQRLALASATLHELGHSLGIAPWTIQGCDNLSFAGGRRAEQTFLNEWGNYRSVMSYYYIWDYSLVDYSDGSHGANDQDDWDIIDLTAFQEETNVIEDPGFELPGEPDI